MTQSESSGLQNRGPLSALSQDHAPGRGSGSNTHNGLLIQNRPFQVPLFPELRGHQQRHLGAQKRQPFTRWGSVGFTAGSESAPRTCRRLCVCGLHPDPGNPTRVSIPPAGQPPRREAAPQVMAHLALDLPGLGDGRQVAGRHHHGPVSRGRWRRVQADPLRPPPPPPAPAPACPRSLGTAGRRSFWKRQPVLPMPPALSLPCPARGSQQACPEPCSAWCRA